jgi:hypothetical protein
MPLTVTMLAVVEFQHTFSDEELETNGFPPEAEPTDEAMQALVIRLENAMRPEFQPRRVELEANTELEQDDGMADLSWSPV